MGDVDPEYRMSETIALGVVFRVLAAVDEVGKMYGFGSILVVLYTRLYSS